LIPMTAQQDIPLIILGGGGHSRVLIDALFLRRRTLMGYTDVIKEVSRNLSVPHIGDDTAVLERDPEELALVNGLGSIGSTASRKRLYDLFHGKGYRFETVVHPSAVVASDVQLGEGVQIMAGAVVQSGTHLGANAIINTGALVDHDCEIGAHSHIAPGAVLSGTVHIGEGTHVGTGAVIIQGVTVGSNSIIGAGTVVLKDVPSHVTFVGVPGKIIRQNAAD
jgi:sugar O-acyltransferase (sialic acid O-acetyltransferase NeuD family)